jgi:hypothetical protein
VLGRKKVQSKIGVVLSAKCFFLPKNNHWLKRNLLVFAFILFDYFSTLVFCRAPYEEANPYARIFMENFGTHLGLTIFVLAANMPIYISLCLDSHAIRFPYKTAVIIESLVDVTFAWFIAGLHFNGATSWFWLVPDIIRQALGALLYLINVFLVVKPFKPCYDNQSTFSV